MTRSSPYALQGSAATWVLQVNRTMRGWSLGVVIASAAGAAAAGAAPALLKAVIDRLHASDGEEAWRSAAVLIVSYGALRAVTASAGHVRTLCSAPVIEAVRSSIFERLSKAAMALPLLLHLNAMPGELSRRVSRTADAAATLQTLASNTVVPLALEVTAVGCVVALVLGLSATMALLLAALSYALGAAWLGGRVSAARRAHNVADGELATLTTSALSGIETAKGLGLGQILATRIEAACSARRTSALTAHRFGGALAVGWALLAVAIHGCVLAWCAWRVSRGELGLGGLVMMQAAVQQLLAPLSALGVLQRDARSALVDLDDARDLAALAPRVRPPCFDTNRAAASIRVEHLCLKTGAEVPRLDGISIELNQGETLAIVGPSGSGKTTLCRVIAGLIEYDSGTVCVGGYDPSRLDDVYRTRLVAYVPQDAAVLAATARETFGLATCGSAFEGAGLEAIGIHHSRGETATRALSGGERRRLGVGLALGSEAPIIIADEPTTGLDPMTEVEILTVLDDVWGGRTKIYATHSPRLARRATKVAVLTAGRLVEFGPPEELAAADGWFSRWLSIEEAA